MAGKTANKKIVQWAHDKRYALVIGVGLLILVVVLAGLLLTPKRSVEAYCKVYKQEKTRLATFPGSTYPSGVFGEELSDAGEISKSYDRLAKVAPADIQKDVETLADSYKQINNSSANFWSAGFASLAPNQSVISWTEKNCSEYSK